MLTYESSQAAERLLGLGDAGTGQLPHVECFRAQIERDVATRRSNPLGDKRRVISEHLVGGCLQQDRRQTRQIIGRCASG